MNFFCLGLIGNGSWIKNYKKSIDQMNIFSSIDIMAFADLEDVETALLLNDNEWKNVIIRSQIDGVVIASSPELQTRITPLLIQLKLPMILEKPFGLSFQKLVNIWNMKNEVKSSILYINHYHLFHPVFRKISSFLENQEVEKITIIDGNSGPFRRYLPPLFDWAPHGVGVILKLMGMKNFNFKADIIYKNTQAYKRKEIWKLNFEYPNEKKGLLIVGNGFSRKIRRIRIDIAGKSKPIIFENNLIQSDEYIDLLNIKKIDIKQSPMNILLEEFYNSLLTGNKDKSGSAKLAYESMRLLDSVN